MSAEIRAAELELGVSFPADYRMFIGDVGRVDRGFGQSWLVLYSPSELVELNRAYDLASSHPELVLIGSDGGGEAVGFDFRSEPPSVVLVNFVSAGWHEAAHQADDFTEFMDQRNAGEEYRFA